MGASPAVFVARLRVRQLRTLYVREYYIPFRLTPDRLLDLVPAGNVLPEHAAAALERIAAGLADLRPAIERVAAARAADLATEHERLFCKEVASGA